MSHRENIDRMISEIHMLTAFKNNEPEKYTNIELEDINKEFDKVPQFNGCILRIFPLYNGIYPRPDSDLFIQILTDLHYLSSPKEIDLLLILHFYNKRDKILSQLIPNIKKEYISLRKKIKDLDDDIDYFDVLKISFKHIILCFGSIDFLKSQNFPLDDSDFNYTCGNGNMTNAQYIFDNLDETPALETGLICACKSGNFELVKWIWSHGLKIIPDGENILYNNLMEFFGESCESGNLELVQYIWNIILIILPESDTSFITSVLKESSFHACKSGNFELVKWLDDIMTSRDINDKNFNHLFNVYLSGNLELAEYILPLCKDSVALDINYVLKQLFVNVCECKNDEDSIILLDFLIKFAAEMNEPFDFHYEDETILKLACKNGHLELVKHLFNLQDVYGMINFHNNNYIIDSDVKKTLFDYACESINLELVEWLWEYSLLPNVGVITSVYPYGIDTSKEIANFLISKGIIVKKNNLRF